MGKECIMLSKTVKDLNKIEYPARVTEKLDGVPGDFYKRDGAIHVRSRQGEVITAVPHLVNAVKKLGIPEGAHIIGEMYHPDMTFKDISGAIRRHESSEESERLILNVFDYYREDEMVRCYEGRMYDLMELVFEFTPKPKLKHGSVVMVPGVFVKNGLEAAKAFDKIVDENEFAEGIVIRTLSGKNSVYKAGWRSPGMIKVKTTLTEDLKIVSFEEAVSKDGEPKGMVGRINVQYGKLVIGVGPGKLKHAERKEVWENQDKYVGKTIEVSYMPDRSYDALREARFYRWRPDKDETTKT